jgi:hypothetical protein
MTSANLCLAALKDILALLYEALSNLDGIIPSVSYEV